MSAFQTFATLTSFKTGFILRRVCHRHWVCGRFFRKSRGQMGKLISHARNISYCVNLACEECCLLLSYVLGTLTNSASCISSLSRSMVVCNQINLVYKSRAEKPIYYKLLYQCSIRFFPPLPTTLSWGEKGGECDLQMKASLR